MSSFSRKPFLSKKLLAFSLIHTEQLGSVSSSIIVMFPVSRLPALVLGPCDVACSGVSALGSMTLLVGFSLVEVSSTIYGSDSIV